LDRQSALRKRKTPPDFALIAPFWSHLTLLFSCLSVAGGAFLDRCSWRGQFYFWRV
jgi:hypothetical protein